MTLRAVAREVGIAAPSIYRHFDDPSSVLAALADRCFVELGATIVAARDAETDSVDRLLAGCRAYLDYAVDRPERYALLFRRQRLLADGAGYVAADSGAAAFALLVEGVDDCVRAGRSDASDPKLAATVIWAGLDGYANLHAHVAKFPWPKHDEVLRRLVLDPARIVDGKRAGATRARKSSSGTRGR